jgi:hypothetical protein
MGLEGLFQGLFNGGFWLPGAPFTEVYAASAAYLPNFASVSLRILLCIYFLMVVVVSKSFRERLLNLGVGRHGRKDPFYVYGLICLIIHCLTMLGKTTPSKFHVLFLIEGLKLFFFQTLSSFSTVPAR